MKPKEPFEKFDPISQEMKMYNYFEYRGGSRNGNIDILYAETNTVNALMQDFGETKETYLLCGYNDNTGNNVLILDKEIRGNCPVCGKRYIKEICIASYVFQYIHEDTTKVCLESKRK